jgi:hypothetical protein
MRKGIAQYRSNIALAIIYDWRPHFLHWTYVDFWIWGLYTLIRAAQFIIKPVESILLASLLL